MRAGDKLVNKRLGYKHSRHIYMEHLQIFVTVLYCITTTSAQWPLTCQVNGNTTHCPPSACDGDQVTFSLTAPQLDGLYVVWMLPNGTCQDSKTADRIVLATASNKCRHERGLCGPFNATNVDPGSGLSCLTSNLTVSINSNWIPLLIQYGTRDLTSTTIVGSTAIQARAWSECHTQGLRSSSFQSATLLHSSMSVSADTIGGVTQLQDTTVSDSSGSSITRNHEMLTTPSQTASDHVIPTWSIIVLIITSIVFCCAIIPIGGCIYYCKCKRDRKNHPEQGQDGGTCNTVKRIESVHTQVPEGYQYAANERCGAVAKGKAKPKSEAIQNQLAKKIRRIDQLSDLKHNKKPLLEIINKHWKELAPKLKIKPKDIRETAKSMCGRALISEWLKQSANPTWGDLIEALKSIRLMSVAQSVEMKLQKKHQ